MIVFIVVPKNSGLKKYREIAMSLLENVNLSKTVEVRGEDIPLFVEKFSQNGKNAIGLTGEDLYREYCLEKREINLQIIRRITWDDSTALFRKPALCLIGPEQKNLSDLAKSLKVCICSKYRKIAKKYLNSLESDGFTFKKIYLRGSVETSCSEGFADLIIDIVYTGSTLKKYGLKIYDKILLSDFLIISPKKTNLDFSERIKKLVRKEVLDLSPVSWGEYDNCKIRLFWGESLIKLPEKIIEKVIHSLNLINRYPDPNQTKLREVLSVYNDVKPENILVGNGSDALIELIAKTFITKGDEVLIPQPSFITYSNVAKLMGGKPVYVKLDGNFNLDIKKLIGSITKRTKVIFLANPNNPTGNYLINEEDVEKLLKSFDGIVVIDECYFEIGGITLKNLLNKFSNIIILRSFSKGFALAGLRIGYALSSPEIIRYLMRVQKIPQPWEVNALAEAAAMAALESKNEILQMFFYNKNLFVSKLKSLNKVGVIETKTSFLLLDFTELKKKTKEIKLFLENKDILTKDCSAFPNFNSYYLYLGIPAEKEMDYVIEALREAIA